MTFYYRQQARPNYIKKLSKPPPKNKNKKWYDNELKKLKATVQYYAALLKQYPFNTNIRKELYFRLRKFNKAKKKKSRIHKQSVLNKLHDLRTRSPNDFWKLLKTLDEKQQLNKQNSIPLPEWEGYFKSLCKRDNIDNNEESNLNIY